MNQLLSRWGGYRCVGPGVIVHYRAAALTLRLFITFMKKHYLIIGGSGVVWIGRKFRVSDIFLEIQGFMFWVFQHEIQHEWSRGGTQAADSSALGARRNRLIQSKSCTIPTRFIQMSDGYMMIVQPSMIPQASSSLLLWWPDVWSVQSIWRLLTQMVHLNHPSLSIFYADFPLETIQLWGYLHLWTPPMLFCFNSKPSMFMGTLRIRAGAQVMLSVRIWAPRIHATSSPSSAIPPCRRSPSRRSIRRGGWVPHGSPWFNHWGMNDEWGWSIQLLWHSVSVGELIADLSFWWIYRWWLNK